MRKFLFSCCPLTGHVQPLLSLAVNAIGLGCEVIFSTGNEFAMYVKERGVEFFSTGQSFDRWWQRLCEEHPEQEFNKLEPHEVLLWYVPNLFAEIGITMRYAELFELANEWQPDVIIHDILDFAAPAVAQQLSIPNISHSLSPALLDVNLYLKAQPYYEMFLARYNVYAAELCGAFRYGCIDIAPSSLQHPNMNVDQSKLIKMKPCDTNKLPEYNPFSGIRAKAKQNIYMTLGTYSSRDVALFSLLLEAARQLDSRILLTCGVLNDPKDFEKVPDNVGIARFVPRENVLPYADLVVCHAGAGTTLGGLAFGLPLVLLPIDADQYEIANLCRKADVAIVVDHKTATATDVANAANRALTDPYIRQACRRVQSEIAAMPSTAQVLSKIESTLD